MSEFLFSFTYLNVYSINNNTELQQLDCKFWQFLTTASSLVNSALASSLLRLGGCCLPFISLMFSNSRTLFLLKISTKMLIVLYLGGPFRLGIWINSKTWSVCFSLYFSYIHFEEFLEFFNTACQYTDREVIIFWILF